MSHLDKPDALGNAAYKGKIEDVQALLSKKADVNYQNDMGQTALMSAGAKGHLDVMKLLIASKADPNLRDKYDNSALLKSSQSGRATSVVYLVEQKADIDAVNQDGDTAIILATRRKHKETVKELVRMDADLQIVGSGDKSVLDRAREADDAEILQFIKDKLATELLAQAKTPRSKAIEFAAFKEMEQKKEEEEKKKKEELEATRKAKAEAAAWEAAERDDLIKEDEARRKASSAKEDAAALRASRGSAPILSQQAKGSRRAVKAGPLDAVEEGTGVLVGLLQPGSPAEKAGLRGGDLITHVNGRRVRNAQEMSEVVGKAVSHEFTVKRQGVELQISTKETASEAKEKGGQEGKGAGEGKRKAPGGGGGSSGFSTPVKDTFSGYPEPPTSELLSRHAHHPLSPAAYQRYVTPRKGKLVEKMQGLGLVSNNKVKEVEQPQ